MGFEQTRKHAWIIWERAEAGARVMKYSYDLSEKFNFNDKQVAVMSELMLRGPQTVGELRTRCERMFPLGDLSEASEVIQSLADYEDGPLVVKLPREPGRRENRYAQLLCGEPDIPQETYTPPPEAAVVAVQKEDNRMDALEEDVENLKLEMAELSKQFAEFKTQFE